MMEKVKSTGKYTLGVFALTFIVVYIMSLTGYYESVEENKKTLTSEAINRFEHDVLNGEVIIASNYVEERESYDNLLSRIGIKFGNVLEFIFKKIMNGILKEIEGAIQ